MSDLRIALVAEGPTDAVIISAALRSILQRPFLLSFLQPESSSPRLGGGWGGVMKWCEEFAKRGFGTLEDDPTLPGFDLFVIHVDADVCQKKYEDYGADCATNANARGWPLLPINAPCPPVTAGSDAMRLCLKSWASVADFGASTILCVPSKSSEAWLGAAVLPDDHALLRDIECNVDIEERLRHLPLPQRIKKRLVEYKGLESEITNRWPVVRRICTEAERFSAEIVAAAP